MFAGGTPVYLAGTLPGELVTATPTARRGEGWAATAVILQPSPDRVGPPCPHFGPLSGGCGGCSLQHWDEVPYAAWKGAQHRTPPGARRRMQLALAREGRTIRLGLYAHRSRTIVDMYACPVLHPALFAAAQALRPVLADLQALRRAGSVAMNLLDTGPDLLLRTDAPLTARDRSALASYAQTMHVARIAWAKGDEAPEPAAVMGPATIAFGGHVVRPPPGAFLQASREGEAAIVAAVLDSVPARRHPRAWAAELFAGCGTITLPLADRLRVVAYEGDEAAHASLRATGHPKVDARRRDLARQPLTAAELKGAAQIVLDPPWAGAGTQMPALAGSGVGTITYVSCNPAALARDERALLANGYARVATTTIDQFLWSARVEVVAVYQKG